MAIAAAALRSLAEGLAGSLIRPEEPEFASVRKRFIGRFEEVLPQAVVRCRAVPDVVAALTFARAHGAPIALRSGGHSFAEWDTTAGLLIDLGPLVGLRLDGELVTVGPGQRLGPLADRLASAGQLVPCGWCPTVAVGGAVLGGGYGVLGRLYGLGCDHLVAAQVVLADGRVVWCDAQRHPDLFWALRGAGGGRFGVVTSLVLRTRPVVPAIAFTYRWRYRHAAAVVEGWLRASPPAPDEVNAELALTATDDPAQEPYLTVFGVAVDGSPERTGLLDRLGPAPDHADHQELSGPAVARHHAYPGEVPEGAVVAGPPPDAPPGLRLSKSEFFGRDLPPDAIVALLTHFARGRTRGEFRDLELIPWGGAIGRVPPTATAFAHRRPHYLLKHTVQVGHRASDARRRAAHRWVTDSWAITCPWGTGMVYPNYADPAVPAWDPAYHGGNLAPLHRIKARYDPEDLFRAGS